LDAPALRRQSKVKPDARKPSFRGPTVGRAYGETPRHPSGYRAVGPTSTRACRTAAAGGDPPNRDDIRRPSWSRRPAKDRFRQVGGRDKTIGSPSPANRMAGCEISNVGVLDVGADFGDKRPQSAREGRVRRVRSFRKGRSPSRGGRGVSGRWFWPLAPSARRAPHRPFGDLAGEGERVERLRSWPLVESPIGREL
jgi:hypothetical protein